MFSISLRVIKIDLNMSDLWQNVCSKYNFNIIIFGVLLYEMTYVLCELYTEVCIRWFVINPLAPEFSFKF
jgi:hypothetical protein